MEDYSTTLTMKGKVLSWDDWCDIFGDYSFFEDLVHEIFDVNKLGDITNYNNVTLGTNAVFRVNDFIVKIFVPKETRIWDSDDFHQEKTSVTEAIVSGIKTPNIVCCGTLKKLQSWDYIVFDYIEGDELGNVLSGLYEDDKDRVIVQLKDFLDKFNVLRETSFDKFMGLNNGRWHSYERRLIDDVIIYLNNLEFETYRVHGDLTKENVLYDGDVFVIDFADSTVAPRCYEYPAIGFDLFDYDLEMTQNLFEDNFPDLISNLLNGLLIHDFGGDMLGIILKRLYIDKSEIHTVNDVKNAIIDIMR